MGGGGLLSLFPSVLIAQLTRVLFHSRWLLLWLIVLLLDGGDE